MILMTIPEAKTIVENYYQKNGNNTEEECFLLTEALSFLIHETNNSRYMVQLGGFYYYQKNYELALKYYTMAAELGNESAVIGLGYIWYYGRTGIVDYEKAYKYFSKVEGDPVADYKLADMYHHGYYVEKNEEKYKEIIEKLYDLYRNTRYVDQPLPEICTRLAEIRENDGNKQEAVNLLLEGKKMLSSRIAYDPFFGNFSIMKGLINNLYRLKPLNKNKFDLFDLYEVFKQPVKVSFMYKNECYIIESSVEDDGTIAVCFLGKWYRSIDDLLMQAKLNDQNITLIAWRFKDFKIIA